MMDAISQDNRARWNALARANVSIPGLFWISPVNRRLNMSIGTAC
jgi:hypothetical protein